MKVSYLYTDAIAKLHATAKGLERAILLWRGVLQLHLQFK